MVKVIGVFIIGLLFYSCSGDSNPVQNNEVDTANVIKDSLAFLDEKIKSNPGNTDWLYERAKYLYRAEDFENSKVDLESALLLDSSQLHVHELYADIQLSLLDLEAVKYHYKYVVTRDTTNTHSLLGLGKLNAILKNSGQAEFYLSRALQINPYLAEAYFLRGIIYRSDYYETGRQESWDIAVSSFQTAVEQDPNYYSAYIEMGVMYDEKKSTLALEYYNSALDIYPESIEAWYNKGMYYQVRGEMDNALAAYRNINQIDSTWADPYYNQGYIHLVVEQGYLDSAIYYFSKAVEIDPEYFQAYNNLGLAYEKNGDNVNAKKNYSKAIEINPEFQLAKDNLNSLQ
jgi:tetratricopeptide (TPR) repeat protein